MGRQRAGDWSRGSQLTTFTAHVSPLVRQTNSNDEVMVSEGRSRGGGRGVSRGKRLARSVCVCVCLRRANA